MNMTIECPSCGVPLVVPEDAAGRKARCTACQARFVIPSREEILEMTVTHLVLDELQHRRHENDDDDDLTAAVPPPSHIEPRLDGDGGGLQTGPGSSTVAGVMAGAPAGESSAGLLSIDDLTPDGVAFHEAAEEPDAAELERRALDELLGEEPGGDPMDGAVRAALGESAPTAYPQELVPARPRPYLVVREVTMKGVRLAFDARWLDLEPFRASMPTRCAFTGAKGPGGLVGRPVIVANRLVNETDAVRAIELRYEDSHHAGRTAVTLLRELGRLSPLHPPFDKPLLYWASAEQAGNSALEARAQLSLDGPESVELLVPCGEVALQWVERVNGCCGPEHGLLARDIAHLRNDAWTALPDKVRQRLDTWCRLQPGERFRAYLNDADFTASDAGLGGVVVTDRRLVYHKFRHLRSVSLNQPAVLHLRPDGRVVRLTLQAGDRLAKAGKIHRSDMNALVDALSDAQRLRITMGRGDGPG